MATSSTAIPDRMDSFKLFHLIGKEKQKKIIFFIRKIKNIFEKKWFVPLTGHISYVRLISTVESGFRIQIERCDWWFRLELFNVDVVLDMHL